MLPVIGELRPWADPTQLQINRLPMRASLPTPPGRRTFLDGDWTFRLFDRPDAVPGTAVSGPTPSARGRWRSVAVPGNWTMQVPEDLPQYTNIQMPFPGPPPNLPDRNPTGPWGAYTDFINPRFGVAALTSALPHRQQTGEGQHIDLALLEAGILFAEPLGVDYTG